MPADAGTLCLAPHSAGNVQKRVLAVHRKSVSGRSHAGNVRRVKLRMRCGGVAEPEAGAPTAVSFMHLRGPGACAQWQRGRNRRMPREVPPIGILNREMRS
jgi:hypothetical protein